MPKITISLSELQLLSDAAARCFTADIENYKMRMELALFKKKAVDLTGPQSAFSEIRTELFKKYGDASEDGQSYSISKDPAKAKQLIAGLEEAMSAKVEVPFPALTIESIEAAKLPLNANELAIMVSVGAIKEE